MADSVVCEVDDSTADGSLTGATGADLGAGLLIGANTLASVLLLLAAATVAAAATIAKHSRTVLETIRSWKLLNRRAMNSQS